MTKYMLKQNKILKEIENVWRTMKEKCQHFYSHLIHYSTWIFLRLPCGNPNSVLEPHIDKSNSFFALYHHRKLKWMGGHVLVIFKFSTY